MKNNGFTKILRASAASLVAAVTSLYLASTASAVTAISLTDNLGDPGKVSISPGDSFVVTFRLSATTEQLLGTTYSIVAPGAGAGKFRISSRDVVGTLFSDLTASNVSNTTLTDSPTVDLGGLVANLALPAQPGNLFLADYTITADPTLAPGIYFLQPGTNSVALDSAFNSLPVSTSSYQVTVVPEPGTAALAFGGAGVLSAMMRRRRSTATS
jgi:uncharacterized protein (TIGR03382 family)